MSARSRDAPKFIKIAFAGAPTYTREIYHFCDFFSSFFDSRTGQTGSWIYTYNGSNDAYWRNDVPFEGFVEMISNIRVQSPLNFTQRQTYSHTKTINKF